MVWNLTCHTPAEWSGLWTPHPAALLHPSASCTFSEACTLPGKHQCSFTNSALYNLWMILLCRLDRMLWKLTNTSRTALTVLSFFCRNSSSYTSFRAHVDTTGHTEQPKHILFQVWCCCCRMMKYKRTPEAWRTKQIHQREQEHEERLWTAWSTPGRHGGWPQDPLPSREKAHTTLSMRNIYHYPSLPRR